LSLNILNISLENKTYRSGHTNTNNFQQSTHSVSKRCSLRLPAVTFYRVGK